MPEPIISIQDFMLLLASLSFPPQINKDISKEKVTPHLFFFWFWPAFSQFMSKYRLVFNPSFQSFTFLKGAVQKITKCSHFRPFLVKFILYIKKHRERS